MREYGRLKVIGTTPKQIRRMVRREGLLLSLWGITLGSFGRGNDRVCNLPSTLELARQSALSGCDRSSLRTDGISVHPCTGRMAAKVSPIEAVRSSGYERQQTVKNQKNHRITPFSMAQMNLGGAGKRRSSPWYLSG